MNSKFLSHKETLIELLNASEEFSNVLTLEEFLEKIGKIVPENKDSSYLLNYFIVFLKFTFSKNKENF